MIPHLFYHCFVSFLLFLSLCACREEICPVYCGPNGFCSRGTCQCYEGYETDSIGACSQEARTKFLGTHRVEETCSLIGTSTYTCTIEKGHDPQAILFKELFTTGSLLLANVDRRRLTIAQQPVTGGTLEGYGYWSYGTTTIYLTYIAGGDSTLCTAILE